LICGLLAKLEDWKPLPKVMSETGGSENMHYDGRYCEKVIAVHETDPFLLFSLEKSLAFGLRLAFFKILHEHNFDS